MTPYPDLELIKRLRKKFIGETIHSMSTDELVDLINHQHERIKDLESAKAKQFKNVFTFCYPPTLKKGS